MSEGLVMVAVVVVVVAMVPVVMAAVVEKQKFSRHLNHPRFFLIKILFLTHILLLLFMRFLFFYTV